MAERVLLRKLMKQDKQVLREEDSCSTEKGRERFSGECDEYDEKIGKWERHVELEREIEGMGKPYYCMAAAEFEEAEPAVIKQGSALSEIKAHLGYGMSACRYKRGLEPKVTPQMQRYIEALCNPKVIRIAVNGSAGTGKTYTAMAYAAMAIKAGI